MKTNLFMDQHNTQALAFFQRRYSTIRLAARGSDVALLSDSDGYVTYGQDAEHLVKVMKMRVLATTLGIEKDKPFRTVVLPPDRVAESIKALTEQGLSVALIDRVGYRTVCIALIPSSKTRDPEPVEEESFV